MSVKKAQSLSWHMIYTFREHVANIALPDPLSPPNQELPEQTYLHPPLTIFVVEHRAFGRLALVGSHVVQSLMDYAPRALEGEPEDDDEESKPKRNCKCNATINQSTTAFLIFLERSVVKSHRQVEESSGHQPIACILMSVTDDWINIG